VGDANVAIGESELNLIGEYVRGNLKEWLREVGPSRSQQDLLTTPQFQVGMGRLDERYVQTQERLIRVEEELKAQREVMVTRFEAMDKRSQDQQQIITGRFEAMDKRFEDQKVSFNDRFGDLKVTFNSRFEDLKASANERFEDLKVTFNDRFEDLKASSNRRFSLLTWMIGLVIALIGAGIGILAV